MAWSQDTEVSVIQRGKLGFVQPLDDREHSGVDETNIGVSERCAQLPYPLQILGKEAFDAICPLDDVVKEVEPNLRVGALVDKVVHLSKDWQRNDEFLVRGLKQATTSPMTRVISIQDRV